jgi:hypothetical protein
MRKVILMLLLFAASNNAMAEWNWVDIGQKVPDGYCLTYGRKPVVLNINEWWARASDFPAIVAQEQVPNVKLDFGDWM